jgi:hypothetical protein
MADDSVVTDAATEASMARATRAATADDAAVAAAAVPGSPADIGAWGPLEKWDVFGIHVALTTDGKVLAYDTVASTDNRDRPTESYEVHDSTRAMVYDPVRNTQVRNDVRGFNLFCTGLAHLGDGSVFLAGGNKNRYFEGLKETHTFRGGMWALGASMLTERWYPTTTTMANGEVLITAGQPRIRRDDGSSPGVADTPEVRTTSGAIRQLPGATRNAGVKREEYPWTQVAPNGDAFIAGPEPRMRSIDTNGSGRLTDLGEREPSVADPRLRLRDYGSHAMYDIGKILISGGARPAQRSALTIDLNGSAPAVSRTADMAFERRQHNLTVLADGSVLATGGLRGFEEQVDLRPENTIYAAERWDPVTRQWKTMAAAGQARQYHSTALLLPDGRVLNSGGGICGRCSSPPVNYAAKDAQIYSPPYLFADDGSPAARPVIASAPDTLSYDAPLQIATPQAGSIQKVAMIRLGAVTHSVDMGQRYVPLQFTRGSGTLAATTPRNANIAPPGPYMLVVTDGRGVPSVAKMVNIGAAPAVALTAPASGTQAAAPASLALEATASDPDGAVTRVEFFEGTTKLGEDTSAPFAMTWSGVPAGTYAVSARATDDSGRSASSAPSTVTVTQPGAAGEQPAAPPAATPGQPPASPPVTAPRPPVGVQPPAAGGSGGSGGSTGTAANPRARIILPASVTITGRTVPVKLSCARACRGTLRIQSRSGATLGRVAFRLTRAGTRTFRVTLSARTRSQARRTPQRLRAAMVVQAGSTRFTARRSFTLRVR